MGYRGGHGWGSTPATRRGSPLHLGAIGLIVVAAGCAAPVESSPEAPPARAFMGLFTTDGDGTWDVRLVAESGEIVGAIDANLPWPVGLAHHPDGFFLTTLFGSQIAQLSMQGETTPFFDEPLSDLHRTWVDEDGGVTVAGEFDGLQLDPEGEVIDRVSLPGQYCWMDAGEGPDQGVSAMLDVFGPTVLLWDRAQGSFEAVGTIGRSGWRAAPLLDTFAADGAGGYYLASALLPSLWRMEADGSAAVLTDFSGLDLEVIGIEAVVVLDGGDLRVVLGAEQGSVLVTVDADGGVTELARSAAGEFWTDLTLLR